MAFHALPVMMSPQALRPDSIGCKVQSAMGEAAAAAVRAVWAQDGPDAARQLYQRMLALPPPGIAVFNAILDLETVSEASSPSKQGPARIQQTFEVGPRCHVLQMLYILCLRSPLRKSANADYLAMHKCTGHLKLHHELKAQHFQTVTVGIVDPAF